MPPKPTDIRPWAFCIPQRRVAVALPTPEQIREDLRGVFRGRLHIDPVTRALYATDASPFEVVPTGVAVPEDAADLQALVKYARESGLSLIPRGAGTGLAGESLGPGLVVDLSVKFRRVLEIAADRVTVEPGVTAAELNAALAPLGRRFAPDPASAGTCTIGGMVATNASGGTVAAHGYTRDHVLGLEVVWDSGDGDGVWGLGSGVWPNPKPQTPNPRTIEIRSQTAALLAEHRELIQLTVPQTRFNRCGYVLHDVLTPAGLDLAKLLVGSEGTLGFVTAATLRTVPLPGGVAVAVVGFPSVDAAVRAGLAIASCDGLVGCDLLDQRLLARTRTVDPAAGIGTVPADVGAALVLTVEADTERDAVRLGWAAIDRLRAAHVHRLLADPTAAPDGTARVRRFRAAAVNGLYALGPGPRPVAGCEDVAVPVEELSRFLAEVRGILTRFDLTASVLAHVPAGIVHLRPFIDLTSDADRAKLWPVTDAVHTLALSLGGTVSGQHGTGIARTPWVEKQSGPLLPVFRELKRIFDPAGILNPGKIVGPDPARPAWPLRVSGIGANASAKAGSEPDSRRPLLTWSHSSPQQEANACNGCGDCRPRTGAVRMCPVFRADGDEAATPRAKANLIRLATGQLTTDEARAVAGLCVHCKMCKSECRAGVDVPKLMLEAKAAYHAEHGLPDGAWLPAQAETLAAMAGRFAFTANALLGNRVPRWFVEKVLGLSRHRTLPRYTHRTFLRRARRLGLAERQGGRRKAEGGIDPVPLPPSPFRLAYFVDTFANTADPGIGEATVAVLRLHGFEVHVPRRQRASGMAPLIAGDLDAARAIAGYNVRTLADLVRDGFTVVCSEPTAAVALTQEYPDLLGTDDAKLVAANTVELTAMLWRLHESGRLKPPTRRVEATVGHHIPCHVKALRGPVAGPRLLGLVPGLTVRAIDAGCSGMAGTWGLTAANRDRSLIAGRGMLAELDRPGVLFGSTECGTCRIQMQDGSRKRTLHPVQYLALAYGLMPEIERRLATPLGILID